MSKAEMTFEAKKQAPKRRFLRGLVAASALSIPVVALSACDVGESCTPRGNSHICN